MKRVGWILLLSFVTLVLLAAPLRADRWFKVAAHDHTDNSDGFRSFSGLTKVAESLGFDALITTDHVEKIAQKKGFEAYLREFQVERADLTVISGVEVTAKNSHTVVFGDINTEIMAELNRALTVSKIISLAQENNLLAVAAHPFDPKYHYDRAQADAINGIEFFNGLIVDYTMTFNWYKEMIDQDKNVFCWAGIDSHSSLDPTDKERWQRQTWVYARSNSAEDICAALSEGHTYASRFGSKLENLNLVPGFEFQKAEPHFKFKVVPKVIFENNYRINFYRDGQVIKFFSTTSGTRSKTIDFLDEKCPAGRHTYLIEIVGLLVTSPIRLEVEGQEDRAENKEIVLGENYSPVPIASGHTTTDFIMGQGRALAFVSTRDGAPALYTANLEENIVCKIMNLNGFEEDFSFSPQGHVLLLRKDGRICLLLVDTDKTEDGSFQKTYKPLLTLEIENTIKFFPAWQYDDSFFCQMKNGEIKLVRFQLSQDSIDEDILDRVSDDWGKVINLLVKFPEKISCRTEPLDSNAEFVTNQTDEMGYERVCVIDRFGKVKRYLTDSGFNATHPRVGQTGMLSMIGSSGPIVFAGHKNGQKHIYRLDGMDQPKPKITKLTTTQENSQPSWAYYSSKIYYTSKRSGSRRIYQMEADGTKQEELILKW